MTEAVLEVHFPGRSLPARGFRCPVCGAEEILAGELQRVQDLAKDLGLFGTQSESQRMVQRHGNSLIVTLDPGWLRRHGVKRGDKVLVREKGDSLVVIPPSRAGKK